MRRTVILALVVIALVASVAGYANAANENVVVTAKVNPKFEMTINKNAVDFTDIDPGTTYSDNSTVITVKSNKAWDFSMSDVVDPMLSGLLTESTSIPKGTGKSKGVHTITATYDLDLTKDAAWQLDPGTNYTATYTYTAVQQ